MIEHQRPEDLLNDIIVQAARAQRICNQGQLYMFHPQAWPTYQGQEPLISFGDYMVFKRPSSITLEPKNDRPLTREKAFRKSIEQAINCFSMENGSDTPDFILAQFLTDCLANFDRAISERKRWYGKPQMSTEEILQKAAQPPDKNWCP